MRLYFKLKIYDQDASKLGSLPAQEMAGLEEVLAQEIVVLAIPAQFLEQFLAQNASLFNPRALVLDVASVKTKPVTWMKKYLPSTVSVLATHPLFGPHSAGESLVGHKVVLYPVRIQPTLYRQVREFLRGLGLEVLEKTPEEHDRQMAYVQALTFFIGRAVERLEIPHTEVNTRTYEYLLSIKQVVQGDTQELFNTIQLENPFAAEVRQSFSQALGEIEENL